MSLFRRQGADSNGQVTGVLQTHNTVVYPTPDFPWTMPITRSKGMSRRAPCQHAAQDGAQRRVSLKRRGIKNTTQASQPCTTETTTSSSFMTGLTWYPAFGYSCCRLPLCEVEQGRASSSRVSVVTFLSFPLFP